MRIPDLATQSLPEHTASMTDKSAANTADQGLEQAKPVPLTVAQAPSFCRLCDVELSGEQTWRAHLKSEEQYVIVVCNSSPRTSNVS